LKRRHVFFQKLPPCLAGIEACASSRELQALGHTMRLMPPAYVKPYVKRQKNDMAHAEAICEAVTRANMRLVPTKTPERQSCVMLHRTRHLFIRQQTAVINPIRVHLAEFGIVARSGAKVSPNCSMLLPTRATNGCLCGRTMMAGNRRLLSVVEIAFVSATVPGLRPPDCGLDCGLGVARYSCYLTPASRRELALSPTCQPRQGGFHKSGMRPIESANVAEAPAFAEFVEEAQ
jgi:hypothetical protein